MSWFDRLKNGLLGAAGAGSPATDTSAERLAEWQVMLEGGQFPSFVEKRLTDAVARKAPWISTMTPSELGIVGRHGVRPVATVSGTCWLHHGYSWTRGHYEGWNSALERMRAEAQILKANAIVDVKMRTSRIAIEDSMDFTVFGTAVYIDDLPTSDDPVIATVPAFEFVRLLRAGIIPTGIAIGADYEWLTNYLGPMPTLMGVFRNAPLDELTRFWEMVRRRALRELRRDAGRLGNGVLAHTHFGQLLKFEGERDAPARYLGRHIVIGTAVHAPRSALNVSPDIGMVVDMRDAKSSLSTPSRHGHTAYQLSQEDRLI